MYQMLREGTLLVFEVPHPHHLVQSRCEQNPV